MVLDKWAWPRQFVVFAATSDLQNPVVKTDTVTKEVDEIMKQWLTLYACITTISLVMAEIGQLGTPMR